MKYSMLLGVALSLLVNTSQSDDKWPFDDDVIERKATEKLFVELNDNIVDVTRRIEKRAMDHGGKSSASINEALMKSAKTWSKVCDPNTPNSKSRRDLCAQATDGMLTHLQAAKGGVRSGVQLLPAQTMNSLLSGLKRYRTIVNH